MNQELTFRLATVSQRIRKKNIVLFFGREEFSDNSKYLYLASLRENEQFEIIWCSRDDKLIEKLKRNGLPCHHISAETVSQTMKLFLSAAVAVFCINPAQSLNYTDALFACLQGARQIQLWHGISVKHLLLKLTPYQEVMEKNFRCALDYGSRADCVLSPTPVMDTLFSESFGCQRLVRAGYPRNEVILRKAFPQELIGSELPPEAFKILKNGNKNIIFVPTWQRGAELITTNETFLLNLATLCQNSNLNLFIKSHPFCLNPKNSAKVAHNFFFINPSQDIYPYLNLFDTLITDYSSIMFDFLLTGKPVLRLKLAPGEHLPFEPDYSLVPDIDFGYEYTEASLPEMLHTALYQDSKQQEREQMRDLLFPTDPLSASHSLLGLIRHELSQVIAEKQSYLIESY